MSILNILYFEENPSEREKVEEVLSSLPTQFHLTTAPSASDFCTLWNEGRYDIVLANAFQASQSDPSVFTVVRQTDPDFPILSLADSQSDPLATDYIEIDQIQKLPSALLGVYLNALFKMRNGDDSKQVWLIERFMDMSTASMTLADLSQKDCPLVYCNQAFEELTGYTCKEVIGKSSLFLQDKERTQTGVAQIQRAIQELRPGYATVRSYKKDGTLFWNEEFLFPIKKGKNQMTHLLSLQNNISGRKSEEVAILLNQEVFDYLDDAVFLFDPKTMKVSVANRRAADQTLLHENELPGTSLIDHLAVDKHDILGLIEDIVRKRQTYYLKTRLRQKNGEDLPVEAIFIPIQFPKRVQECLAIVKDLTEVQQSELMLHEVTDTVPGMVYQFKFFPDGKRKFTFVSAGSRDLIGYTSEQVIENWDLAWNRVHPKDVESLNASILESAINQTDWSDTFRVLDREGRTKWIEGKSSIVKGSLEKGAITWNGFLMDITTRVKAEQQLGWLQNMESMGRLAGGIAHDFNNQLFVILGNCELLLKKSESAETHELIEEVNLAATRSADLTKQLLTFSRRQVNDPVVLNLHELKHNLKGIISTICKDGIAVEFDIDQNLWNVKIDINQIEQVITNLMINAKDAMPKGGTIVIKMENYHSDGLAELESGDWVIISVCDNGVGIPREMQGLIFEPFFTTKRRGKGTGLGLSTSFGIIRQAGGHLLVESESGKGSTFKICLRRCGEKIEESQSYGSDQSLPIGTETLVIVDDEAAVRRIIAANLRELGYKVIEAIDGEEALKTMQDYGGEKIYLLITDVMMPKLRGDELIKTCRRKWPHMKFLAITGYTSGHILSGLIVKENQEFLYKPFSPSTLAYKVREILDNQG